MNGHKEVECGRIKIKISTTDHEHTINIEHLSLDLLYKNDKLLITYTLRDSDDSVFSELLGYVNEDMSKSVFKIYIIDEDDNQVLVLSNNNKRLFMIKEDDYYGRCIKILDLNEVI